jgi:hypothetical protein
VPSLGVWLVSDMALAAAFARDDPSPVVVCHCPLIERETLAALASHFGCGHAR